MELSWTAPEGDVDGYRILRRRPDDGESQLLIHESDTGSVSTTWTDTAVTDGTRYFYRVQVIRDGNVGPSSGYVKVRWRAPSLDPPTGLSGSVEDDGVLLSWTAPEGDVDGYRILRRRPDDGESQLLVHESDTGSVSTTWTDTAVTDGTRYFYRVQVIRDGNVGPSSGYVKVRWRAPSLDPPTGLTASVEDDGGLLSWTAPDGDMDGVSDTAVRR